MMTYQWRAAMLNETAHTLAARMCKSLRQKQGPRALWIVGGTITQTEDTDAAVDHMRRKRAVLVGVFDGDMPAVDMAEAIIEAAAGA